MLYLHTIYQVQNLSHICIKIDVTWTSYHWNVARNKETRIRRWETFTIRSKIEKLPRYRTKIALFVRKCGSVWGKGSLPFSLIQWEACKLALKMPNILSSSPLDSAWSVKMTSADRGHEEHATIGTPML